MFSSKTVKRFLPEKYLMILSAFFVVSLVISNVIAAKVVQIGWFEIPAAVLAYPITFLMTDIISEIFGKHYAKTLVKIGFAVQLFSLVLIYLAIYLPPTIYMVEFDSVFQATLGSSARFVLASLIAYLVAQTIDVHMFHALKARFTPKWIRNNGSTMISQLADTSIFITIAFIGVVPNIGIMIVSQYVVKFCFAALDTPIFYFITQRMERKLKEVNYENS